VPDGVATYLGGAMRLTSQLSRLAICLFLVMGCEDATATRARSDLVGTWARAPEDLSPNGWYQVRMTFAPSGTFTEDVRSHGVYPGQPRDELSSYVLIEGTYRTEGDRLIVTPRRMVTWDRFYGSSSPEVREPYPYTDYLDDMRYGIQGEELTLRYTSYPADAPVPTTMVLLRER
jgi:hypothetical protein